MIFSNVLKIAALTALATQGLGNLVPANNGEIEIYSREADAIAIPNPAPAPESYIYTYDKALLKRDGLLSAIAGIINGALGNGIDGILNTINQTVQGLIEAATKCDGVLNDIGASLHDIVAAIAGKPSSALNNIAEILTELIQTIADGIDSHNILVLIANLISGVLNAVAEGGADTISDISELFTRLLAAITSAEGSCPAAVGPTTCPDGFVASPPTPTAPDFNAEGILKDIGKIINDAITSITGPNDQHKGILQDVLNLLTTLIGDIFDCDGLVNDIGSAINQAIKVAASKGTDAFKEITGLLGKLISDFFTSINSVDLLKDLSQLINSILHTLSNTNDNIADDIADLLQELLRIAATGGSSCRKVSTTSVDLCAGHTLDGTSKTSGTNNDSSSLTSSKTESFSNTLINSSTATKTETNTKSNTALNSISNSATNTMISSSSLPTTSRGNSLGISIGNESANENQSGSGNEFGNEDKDISTTIITITSCSEHGCSKTPVTTGVWCYTQTENGVEIVYTTYCPLTSFQTATCTEESCKPTMIHQTSTSISSSASSAQGHPVPTVPLGTKTGSMNSGVQNTSVGPANSAAGNTSTSSVNSYNSENSGSPVISVASVVSTSAVATFEGAAVKVQCGAEFILSLLAVLLL